MTEFSMLELDSRLTDALARMNITEPTPIQARAIPPVMQGRDLMGLAQTGTGKTLAFGLPLVHMLLSQQRPAAKYARSLILAPTRELVNQISDVLRDLSTGLPLRITAVVGGASLVRQAERLAKGTDILVATPGRLIDLMDRGDVLLGGVKVLVLDEADQMLDLGFIHALRRIAKMLPEKRQTLLFSATMPKQMAEIAEAYLTHPVQVQVNPSGKTVDKIEQSVHFVSQGDKAKLLSDCLAQHPGESALVFSRTKHGAEKLMKVLVAWGYSAASIHGNKSQNHRERTLAAFRSGELKVLVATDVAARGIDIPLVAHVYNLDLPNVAESYVHRIGRTARAGRAGRAVAFCAPAEMEDLRAIEALIKQRLTVAGGIPWPEDLAQDARAKARVQTPGRGGQGAGRQGAGRPGAGKPGAGKSGPPAVSAAKPGRPRLHPAQMPDRPTGGGGVRNRKPRPSSRGASRGAA